MKGPIILISLGVLLLLNNLYPEAFRLSRMWPVILIVIGLIGIAEYLLGKISTKGTNEPPQYRSVFWGAILITIGGLLLAKFWL
jgi:choline-glycine betaine transporter